MSVAIVKIDYNFFTEKDIMFILNNLVLPDLKEQK